MRQRGITWKIVEGVLEIRSLKCRQLEHGELAMASPSNGGQGAGSGRAKSKEQGAGSKEQRAKSREQGARNAARFGYRLSVLGYQVDKGEQK